MAITKQTKLSTAAPKSVDDELSCVEQWWQQVGISQESGVGNRLFCGFRYNYKWCSRSLFTCDDLWTRHVKHSGVSWLDLKWRKNLWLWQREYVVLLMKNKLCFITKCLVEHVSCCPKKLTKHHTMGREWFGSQKWGFSAPVQELCWTGRSVPYVSETKFIGKHKMENVHSLQFIGNYN